MVRISFLATSFLFILILFHCNTDGFMFKELEMLACPQTNNITIIVDDIDMEFSDDLLHRLEPLTRNKDCFTINVYLPSDGFVVQWRPNFNVNQFEWNFPRTNSFLSKYIDGNDLINFLKRLYNEQVMGNNTVKQTLVYSYTINDSEEIFQTLQGLQVDRLWNIILNCQEICYLPNWLPINRFFFSFYATPVETRNIFLKNLLDVIKEPDFDRYEYMHQYLLSRDDLFNETCMTGITMINIYTKFLPHDVCFPFFVALLKKVSALREIKKKQPLRISTTPFNRYSHFVKQILNEMFGLDLMTNVRKPIDSDAVVSLHIQEHDWRRPRSDEKCKALSEPNIKLYRLASLNPPYCLNAVKMKTFESLDDLIEMMNEDICKRRKLD